MAEGRVELIAPTGQGRARVAAGRVEAFKAMGWRDAAPAARKAPTRRRKPASEDEN